ncbi:MAG: DUF3822 family protein [Bacteroidia bacterium]|nr:DUF3822 family protein [Bacteroidia bacterium]
MDKIFKQEVSIKDEKFDIDDMSYYRLYITVGEDNFRFCVIDSLQNRCMLLEDYHFFRKLSSEELVSSLNRIYDSNLFLKANFWQSVSIVLKGNAFTLVPREFFEESSPEKYLRLVAPKLEQMLVVVAEQQSLDAVNIFQADNNIVNWFHQTYPTRVIEFLHQTSAFIEGTRHLSRDSDVPSVHAFVEASYMIINVMREDQLELCNVFPFKSGNDLIYFTLFVMDELRLDKDTTPLFLYGNIELESEIYRSIRSYLGRVTIQSELPPWSQFNYQFQEASTHYYFDLFSMHLCPHS